MRKLCAVVLVFEAIVLGLAIPVAIQLGEYSPSFAGGLWGGLAAAALVLAGLQRHSWAFYTGGLLQLAVLASGVLVPSVALLGIVFAGLWCAGVLLGRRTDIETAA